jgi:leucyl-tRNA synthetase
MELLNEVGRYSNQGTEHNNAQGLAVEREALQAAVLLLAPVTPHICHSLWQALGNNSALVDTPWPQVDEKALARSSITLVIQVNGKVRAKLEAPADADKTSLEQLALAQENVQKFIGNATVRKVIVVPGKLVNIVVG